jgi:hypothetical protein
MAITRMVFGALWEIVDAGSRQDFSIFVEGEQAAIVQNKKIANKGFIYNTLNAFIL